MSRLDPTSAITPVGGQAPANWLTGYAQDTSLQNMQEMRVLQRIRVLQSNSPRELREKHGERNAIIMPASELVCKKTESFFFVPVLFFKEYIEWADRNDTSNKNAILNRSFDPTSEIAKKAADAKRRKEKYYVNSQEFNKTYTEHLNFAGIIINHPMFENQPVVVGFARGEWRTGSKFVNQILMRRNGGAPVPLWAQRWEFVIANRVNDKKQEWDALDPRTPSDGQLIIDEALAPVTQQLHRDLAEAHAAKQMMVDRSDESEETREDVTNAEM